MPFVLSSIGIEHDHSMVHVAIGDIHLVGRGVDNHVCRSTDILGVVAPAVFPLVPDLQLSYGTALVPLLNIVLLARDLLSGFGSGPMTLVVVVATVVYGYIALVLAAHRFGPRLEW